MRRDMNIIPCIMAVVFVLATLANAQGPGQVSGGRPRVSMPKPGPCPLPILPALPDLGDTGFYAKTDVPHGHVVQAPYKNFAGQDKRMHVYLPPDYEMNTAARYPVLYLNHGGGDDDSKWTSEDPLKVFETNYQEFFTDPKTNDLFRVPFYMAAGETDIALRNGQKTLAILNQYGIRNFWVLSSGGHEWANWRRYLFQTAQIMFPEDLQTQVGEPQAIPPQTGAPGNTASGDSVGRRRGGLGGPVVLGPDDKPAFPDPPAGFNVRREGIPHGRLEMVEYDSKTVGTRRKMQVYTPPGYSSDRKYPVLYLLHGIGGDETEWQRYATPDVLLDNLLADQKAVPMIVVMPNGRAQKNDRAEGNVFSHAPAFAVFEQDLLKDVIPAIESRYSVQVDREHRAIAGLSMGGGQALNFGLGHLETFAWVGGFSSAPNTRPPAELVPDPAAATQRLRLLWLACGNKDGLINISQGVHAFLKEKGVPHVWHVDSHAHDPTEWRNNLYLFVQRIFR